MICENCGSKNVRENVIQGYRVDECQVCGHLHGNADAIKKITEIREARETSVDPLIYPLYKIINSIGKIEQIQYACPGYPQEKVPPYISFYMGEAGSENLETLAASLIDANKRTQVHWILEVTFQRRLTFVLKPNFHHDPYYISVEQISLAQKDIAVLAQCIQEKLSA